SVSPHQTTGIVHATDHLSGSVAMADAADAVSHQTAGTKTITSDRSGGEAAVDTALKNAHQATDIIRTTDYLAGDITVADTAAVVEPQEAANIKTAGNIDTCQTDVADFRCVSDIAERADTVRGGPFNKHPIDSVTQSIKRAGEW